MNAKFVLSSQLVSISLLGVLSSASLGALVTEGEMEWQVTPIQDLTLIAGTPFNQTSEDIQLLNVAVPGVNRWSRLAQQGDEIRMVSGEFEGTSSHPLLGSFTLRTGESGGFSQMVALLSNVVQDPNHPGFASGDVASVISADIVLTVPDWGVRLNDLNVDLEVRDPFFFTGSIDGLPPSIGTEIADPFIGVGDQLEVFIAGTDTLVGYSTNRRLVLAVPEPSAAFGLVLGAAALIRRRPRRR